MKGQNIMITENFKIVNPESTQTISNDEICRTSEKIDPRLLELVDDLLTPLSVKARNADTLLLTIQECFFEQDSNTVQCDSTAKDLFVLNYEKCKY